MWLSKQIRPASQTADADMGTTSIAGKDAGVVTKGEVRDLPVYGPGGYVWLPENGTAVLVVKGGPGGEEQCVAGARQSVPEGMQPGEVMLFTSGGNRIYLQKDGSIQLRGTVDIQGNLNVYGGLSINGKSCDCTKGGA